jgi:hypothetical protein
VPGPLDSRIIFDDTVDENNPRGTVSSLVLMRILESAPERYDGGMRLTRWPRPPFPSRVRAFWSWAVERAL